MNANEDKRTDRLAAEAKLAGFLKSSSSMHLADSFELAVLGADASRETKLRTGSPSEDSIQQLSSIEHFIRREARSRVQDEAQRLSELEWANFYERHGLVAEELELWAQDELDAFFDGLSEEEMPRGEFFHLLTALRASE